MKTTYEVGSRSIGDAVCQFFKSVLTMNASIEIDANTEPAVNVIQINANAEGPCFTSPRTFELQWHCGFSTTPLDAKAAANCLIKYGVVSGGEVFEILPEKSASSASVRLPGMKTQRTGTTQSGHLSRLHTA